MYSDHDIYVNVFDEQENKIVRMELGDIVIGATAAALPECLEIEAVKALAVTIRTIVVKRLKQFDGIGCEKCTRADICTGMKGFDCISSRSHLKELLGDKFDELIDAASIAAESTSGVIITCGGRPAGVDYHLTCGGGTENSEDVLGNKIMYFRKVLCKYCVDSRYWETYVDIPVGELEEKLKVRVMKGSSTYGPEMEGLIQEIERDETGRIRRLKIGGKYFTGIEVMNALGLSSSRFGWDPAVIRFKARGSGSGLGMCLYGANGMAKEGKDYSEILKYYFTGINIENIDIAGEGTPLKGKVFIIDPGHGGQNSDDEKGTTGLREKDVNLKIGLMLSEMLKSSGADVKLTRNDDRDLSLPQRIQYVNSIRPNFLISIHQNSFFSTGVSGTEVYYYRGDIEGEKMGKMILENIVKGANTVNRGNRMADFYLLRESKVSAVIVECMYITNPNEEQRLKDEGVLDCIARSIYRGIMDYYGI